MKFKAEFEMDNAAFEDNPFEVSDLLIRIGDKIGQVGTYKTDKGLINDTNGNKIGSWEISK